MAVLGAMESHPQCGKPLPCRPCCDTDVRMIPYCHTFITQATMFGCGCWADQRPGVPSNAVACSTSGESHVTPSFLFEFHTLCTHFRYRWVHYQDNARKRVCNVSLKFNLPHKLMYHRTLIVWLVISCSAMVDSTLHQAMNEKFLSKLVT